MSWVLLSTGSEAPLSTPGSPGISIPLQPNPPQAEEGPEDPGMPGCLLPSKQPKGHPWRRAHRASSSQRGHWPLSMAVVFHSWFLRVVLARSHAALPGISDSCLQLQLFPDKRLAPPRLGLGLFGECCRGGLSCSLLQECWPDGQILLPSCKMSDVGRLWESSLPVPPPLDKPAWPAPPCHGNGPFQPQPH